MSDDARKDELDQAREMVKKLSGLMEHEGWLYFMAMLQRQENNRLMKPPQSTDGFGSLLSREFEHGEIAGLRLAQHLAQGSIAAAKQLLQEDLEEKDEQE